jgi:hypothetical protein
MNGRDTLGVKRGDYAVTITVGWVEKRPVSLCATTVSNQYYAFFQHLDGIISNIQRQRYNFISKLQNSLRKK